MTDTPEHKDTSVTIIMYGNRYKGVLREFTDNAVKPILFIVVKSNDNPSDVALPLGTIRDLFYEGVTLVEGERPVATIVEPNGHRREVALAEAPSEMAPELFPGTSKIDQVVWHTPPTAPAPAPAEPSGVGIRRLAKKIDEMRKVIDELVSEVKLPEQAVPEPVPVSPTVPETAAAEARRLWESDHTAFVLPPEATLTYDRHTNESVAVFDGKISITMTEERLRGLIAAGALDFFDHRGGRVHPDTEMARRRLSLSAEVADNVIRSLKSFDWARGEDKTDNG